LDRHLDLNSTDHAAPKGHTTMSEATADRAPAVERLARRLAAAAGDPKVAAEEGILGLADRADAAELAGARTSGDASQMLDLALRTLLERESAPSPVKPSTTRPEFTTLLDQLRTTAGAPAAPAPQPQPAPAAQAAPAPIPAPRLPAQTPAQTPVQTPAAAAVSAASAAYGAPTAAPVAPVVPLQPRPLLERQTLGRGTADRATTRDRREDVQLAEDRRVLRSLGVPPAWTRALRPGDRFTSVLRMLDRMPDVDIDPATRVVAVVGPSASVRLEAHRTALDLATGPAPRPVVVVPARAGAERGAALTEARHLGDVVVAIEADGDYGTLRAVESLQTVDAGAVIALVSAADPIERSQAMLDALGQVDALAVEGTASADEPAAVLQLGLPVVRLEGIPVDRFTWSAVLCAQLVHGSAS
ncbi:MAG TPA: hypothetical protein VEV65_13435, partial [Kineosporiaceae bacterium]|nr:hypothetical protein [Kineosporiaceae bacterium]